jgi:hypothetical protein
MAERIGPYEILGKLGSGGPGVAERHSRIAFGEMGTAAVRASSVGNKDG